MKSLKIILLIISTLLLTPPVWADQEPIISNIDIQIIGSSSDADELADRVREMIYLKAGERLSPQKFNHSKAVLEKCGLFEEIDFPDPDFKKPDISLTIRLKPVRRIREIRIDGGFPLLEREILNAMTITVGAPFYPEDITPQEAAISRIFLDEGYIDPLVSVSPAIDGEDDRVVVSVDIQKGNFYRISKVEMTGNHAISSARLKMRLNTWFSSLYFGEIRRFVQKDLDEDVKNLLAFYRKQKFADATVEAKVTKNKETREADIRFVIVEGAQYDISFEGNKEFWGLTLKKDLVLFQKGNRGDLGLRRSLRKIRQRYHDAGYLRARVEMTDSRKTKGKKEFREILVKIEEGPRSITEAVTVTGNRAVETEAIEDRMLTRMPGIIADGEFVPETLEEDKKAVEALYLEKGFREAAVSEQIRKRDDPEENRKIVLVDLKIQEGKQTLISDAAFSGLQAASRDEALAALPMKPGEPFDENRMAESRTRLAALISEKGYPHVSVKSRFEIIAGGDRVRLFFEIDEGPYVEMGQVFITGNFRTRDRIFYNELALKPGDPFSLKAVSEAQRNIRNISALDGAKFNLLGLEEKAEQAHLLVTAEEKKPWYFQIGGGYDSAREFFINAKAGDRNLLGLNKDAWVSLEYSQIGYRGEINLTEPRFLGTRISSAFNVFAEESEEKNQDFGTRTQGASVGFSRDFWKNFNAGLTVRYEYREQYRLDDDTGDKDEDLYDPRSIVVTTPSLTYNSVDSFIRPRKGLFASASVDVSNGLDSDQDDFLKYRLEMRYFYTPLERLTLAVRGRYGYIDPFNSGIRISDDQLFFLGGTADVRGFDENRLRFDDLGDPLGGRQEILGSLEARFDAGMNFELAAFYDTGAVRDAFDADDSGDLRSSAGLCIRYITPIGPVGFAYGWKLDKKEGEDAGKLHFSIGYTF